MRPLLGILLLAALIGSGCVQSAGTPAPATGNAGVTDVVIQNFAFAPADLTVGMGTTVRWTNQDSVAHTVTGTGFDSGTRPIRTRSIPRGSSPMPAPSILP